MNWLASDLLIHKSNIMNSKRYILQQSSQSENDMVLTDTELGIVVTFKRYKFNETQKFTLLEDVRHSTTELASVARSMTDWLVANHPEVVMRNIRKYIGDQIRDIRKSQGLTTRQLAEKCGLSHSHISRIESGRYSVTIDTLAVIADALGMEIKIVDK